MKLTYEELEAHIVLLRDALDKIANWNECTTEFRVSFGSNGERDFYRNVAKSALDKCPKDFVLQTQYEACSDMAKAIGEGFSLPATFSKGTQKAEVYKAGWRNAFIFAKRYVKRIGESQ